jgi:hypothetical protein
MDQTSAEEGFVAADYFDVESIVSTIDNSNEVAISASDAPIGLQGTKLHSSLIALMTYENMGL